MQNFQDTFETRKRSLIDAFSICMKDTARKRNPRFTAAVMALLKQQWKH